MFKVTFTADKHSEASIARGDMEEGGFVDLNWNRYGFLADGEQKFEEFDTREQAEAHILDGIGEYEQSGDSYYGIDGIHSGEFYWTYAGHIEEV